MAHTECERKRDAHAATAARITAWLLLASATASRRCKRQGTSPAQRRMRSTAAWRTPSDVRVPRGQPPSLPHRGLTARPRCCPPPVQYTNRIVKGNEESRNDGERFPRR